MTKPASAPPADARPDFEALRAQRNAQLDAFAEKLRAEGWEVSGCCLHDKSACYCACPDGPCEHTWDGKPYESEDGGVWSMTCSRCGTTSMSHSLRTMP